jgi:hypothetical protein
MGLPFETPGGYEDDNTTPDASRYTDDLTPGDYDGYGQDMSGGSQGAAGEDSFFDDDYDDEDDEPEEPEEGDRAGWDPGTGLMGGSDRM